MTNVTFVRESGPTQRKRGEAHVLIYGGSTLPSVRIITQEKLPKYISGTFHQRCLWHLGPNCQYRIKCLGLPQAQYLDQVCHSRSQVKAETLQNVQGRRFFLGHSSSRKTGLLPPEPVPGPLKLSLQELCGSISQCQLIPITPEAYTTARDPCVGSWYQYCW